jgi:hypothetical protein
VRLKGLGQLMIFDCHAGSRTRDRPVCSRIPQPTSLSSVLDCTIITEIIISSYKSLWPLFRYSRFESQLGHRLFWRTFFVSYLIHPESVQLRWYSDWLRTGRTRFAVRVPVGSRIFSFSLLPDWLWGPIQPHIMRTDGYMLRDKAAGAWSWLFTCN